MCHCADPGFFGNPRPNFLSVFPFQGGSSAEKCPHWIRLHDNPLLSLWQATSELGPWSRSCSSSSTEWSSWSRYNTTILFYRFWMLMFSPTVQVDTPQKNPNLFNYLKPTKIPRSGSDQTTRIWIRYCAHDLFTKRSWFYIVESNDYKKNKSNKKNAKETIFMFLPVTE